MLVKSSDNRLRKKLKALAQRYETALRRYLKQNASDDLQTAVKLGRQAVALRLETLDMTLIHEQALLKQILPAESHAPMKVQMLRRAGAFFAEAITPIEEGHRSAIEHNDQLNRINEELNQRTLDLATSNRQLKKEVSRRKVVEKTLRKSEQQTTLLLEESRILQQQLRLLSRRVLLAQENERKRISRELHDVVVQLLSGINVRLATLKKETSVNTRKFSQEISDAQRLVVKSVDIVHQFARELRPAMLDDLGLTPALHSYLKKFTKETGVRASLTTFEGIEKLSNAKRTVIYRVVQEALTNVGRHAHASRVKVCIQKLPTAVSMYIKDDGKSFDVEQMWHSRKSKRLGLLGMRERVEMVRGTFRIESDPGQGTTILVKIPYRTKAAKPESNRI
ncbi:MAG: histidine kinase [Kiritimatiellae bacterium]|jgi:signal transduction histidine kinase|nr:histidine kinase [Kiritimatiellia bacterium]